MAESRAGAEWPRISVVTPSYNQADFLEETIQSVLNQEYPNLEYMIIDGGSTDGSVDIIRRLEDRLAWWVSEKDRGQAHAINKGLERATGDVFAFLNSDDLYTAGALRRVGAAFRENPPALLYGKCRYVDAEGAPMDEFPFHPALDLETVLADNLLPQPSAFVRMDVCREVGRFDETMHYAFDHDYWVRAMLRGYRLSALPELLSLYRLHPSSKTQTSRSHFDADMEKVHGRVRAESLPPARRRRLRSASARFYRRLAFENYAWEADLRASVRYFARMIAADPRACDVRAVKVFARCCLRIAPPRRTKVAS
ncbi:MAG: glycosyltransferase [Chthonomonadales bacterium]|nr:glycosyltransferase [Chthonomonadales bacterium]